MCNAIYDLKKHQKFKINTTYILLGSHISVFESCVILHNNMCVILIYEIIIKSLKTCILCYVVKHGVFPRKTLVFHGRIQKIPVVLKGLNFYKSSHARMFSCPKILFLVSLLFVALLAKLNPYLPLEF